MVDVRSVPFPVSRMKTNVLIVGCLTVLALGSGVVYFLREEPAPAAKKSNKQRPTAHAVERASSNAHAEEASESHDGAGHAAVAVSAAHAPAETSHAVQATAAPEQHGAENHGATAAPSAAAHAAHPTAAETNEHASSGVALWTELLAGNARFVSGTPEAKSLVEKRGELAKGQKPKVIVLACADSRVSPELLFDQGLGDLFVVRTAGNIADAVALGSMEYAVEHLHAELIVVVGHEKCGAVAAAASGDDMPSENLDAIVGQIRPALRFLASSYSGEELVAHGVEANVHASARNLVERSEILAHAVEENHVAIVKAKYELASGRVVTLE